MDKGSIPGFSVHKPRYSVFAFFLLLWLSGSGCERDQNSQDSGDARVTHFQSDSSSSNKDSESLGNGSKPYDSIINGGTDTPTSPPFDNATNTSSTNTSSNETIVDASLEDTTPDSGNAPSDSGISDVETTEAATSYWEPQSDRVVETLQDACIVYLYTSTGWESENRRRIGEEGYNLFFVYDEDRARQYCDAWLGLPGIRVTKEELLACHHIRERQLTETTRRERAGIVHLLAFGLLEKPIECGFRGEIENNASCVADAQCRSGLCKENICTETFGKGAACLASSQCSPGLGCVGVGGELVFCYGQRGEICIAGTCQVQYFGKGYRSNIFCPSGIEKATQTVNFYDCLAPLEAGEQRCGWAFGFCPKGMECSTKEIKCVSIKGEGESCSEPICQAPLICRATDGTPINFYSNLGPGICSSGRGEGESGCWELRDCAQGLTCREVYDDNHELSGSVCEDNRIISARPGDECDASKKLCILGSCPVCIFGFCPENHNICPMPLEDGEQCSEGENPPCKYLSSCKDGVCRIDPSQPKR